ncbi:DUF4199 domain-containing protein [Flavobacteriaceae bacterium S356]|uniref:DUF4199 domain-containing protein n=1 Tax=Asprobacillus argus TaxID=3076534 RepID=A0ABU3LCD5_9FLAO|nr:DUF4199 domain-containing protein [Flavobacteriaceae bacterium S356]
MKKTIIRYGFYGFLTAVVLFLSALVFGQGLSFETQTVLGYVSIVASLSFVYFGIKHFRDRQNNGVISFGKALGVGMLITLFAALGFAIIDYLYTAYINPDFIDQYAANSMSNLEKTLSGDDLVKAKEDFTSQMESMGSSSALAFFMFVIVTVIGFIISLLSSLFLNKKQS